MDSCRFMASSLNKLASKLNNGLCKRLKEFYIGEKVLTLMRHKGIYQYEYRDSWEKFEETTPQKCILQQAKHESNQDYGYVREAWNRITPVDKNVILGDFHDFYLATDPLLLANVFETFQNLCLEHFKLNPVYFCIMSGLTCLAY